MAVIKFFASVKDKMGTDSMQISLNTPSPVREVLTAVAHRESVELSALVNDTLMYAVNQEMAGLNHIVSDSDELAVLPPLSGGV